MKLAVLTFGIALACGGVARAQAVAPDDAPPPSPPPSTTEYAPPQQYVAPQQNYAPPPGYQLVPVPTMTPEQINEMEAQGRHRKVIGGILVGFGILTAVVGLGLLIAYEAKGATTTCIGSTCVTDDGKSFLYASIAIDTGAPFLLGFGLPLLSSGIAQVRRARSLRNGTFVPVSLAPSVDRHGGGLRLAVAF